VRKWNPSLHPRGPDGRFTKSSARPATPKQKQKIDYVRRGPKRKPFKSQKEAATALARTSTVPAASLPQLPETNRALRSGRPAPDNALAEAMTPTPEPMTMFRSVPRSEFGDVAPEDLRGFVVRDAGFFPASAAPTTPVPGEVRMTIDVPAGTPAAGSPETSELVLDAGVEMSVDEVTTTPDGSTEMHLTALPAEGATPDVDTPGEAIPAPETAPETDGPATFDARVEAAATGIDARDAAPASLIRDSDPPLTRDQQMALEDYGADNYEPINRMLRGGDPQQGIVHADRETTQAWVDSIDEVMGQSRLTSEIQTWRGLDNARRLFGSRIDGDLTGMEWREDSYASTSADRAVSEEFATTGRNPDQVLMRIVVPPGVGAVEISGTTGSLPESEVLLQRGLTLRVATDNGVDANGVRHIDVEVVPVDAAQGS
jgi:hypothetical protein